VQSRNHGKLGKSETKCSCTEILFLVDDYILSDLSKEHYLMRRRRIGSTEE
jgi:hypothetical protein